ALQHRLPHGSPERSRARPGGAQRGQSLDRLRPGRLRSTVVTRGVHLLMSASWASFVECFHAVVERHGDRPAVVWEGKTALTYAGLDRRARRLAGALGRQGAGRETVVGLCLEKSVDHLVALLATWYAGAAFLPLEPALPRDRLAFMVGDSCCRLAVAQPGGERFLEGLDLRFVHPNAGGGDFKPAPLREDDLAYVIYTSGSTGAPKGVLVEQRGIVNL